MKNFPGRAAALAALTATLFISGCLSDEALNDVFQSSSGSQSDSPPRIVYFKAEPPEMGAGGTSFLKWKTENATSVTISGVGGVSPAGSGKVSVRPQGSVTYELTATNGAGQSAKESARIIVMVPMKGKLPPGTTPPATPKLKTPLEVVPKRTLSRDLKLLVR